MGIPDRVSSDLKLPERRLLRGRDRLQDYAGAFLRGEITAEQYATSTLAEINRRAPVDPLLPSGEDDESVTPTPVAHLVHEDPPRAPAIIQAPAPRLVDRARSIVLARAFVKGHLDSVDFLRRIRDC